MKGETYGRRFVDFKPIRSVLHLADEHAPDLTNHDKHIRDVLAYDKQGFLWKELKA